MSEAVVDLGRIEQWYGRGRDGRTIKMRSRVKDGVLVLRPHVRDWREWVVWASGKSNDWISKVANGVWNHASVTFPSTLYFALWTTTLTAASTGSSGTEFPTTSGSATAYTRTGVTANTTNFPTSSSGAAIQNATAISWPAMTGSTPVTVTYVAVCDASTAGNILYWGSVTSATVNTGDTAQININGLTATEA